MKLTFSKIAVPALCASLLLAGCAAQEKADTTNTLADNVALDVTESSDAVYAEITTEAQTSAAAEENESGSGWFSDRDMGGDYDENTVAVQLTGTGATASSDSVSVSGSNVVISGAGTYQISGSLENGSIIVNAAKEDKVQLVMNGVSIHSDSYAAIYVKQADKVFITLAEGTQNTLSNGGSFTQQDENDVDAVIYARDDVTFNGSGTLTVSSPAGHGIVGKDEVTITGGVYTVTSAQTAIRANDSIAIADGVFTLTAGTDGLHAENSDDDTLGNIYIAGGSFTIKADDDAIHANPLLQIDGGSMDINAAEGLEGTYIQINDGSVSISASDDGVNAARKSSAYTPTVEVTGGELVVVMGPGDTDGVDSNGDILISGGTVNVTGQSAFDYDGSAQYTGGTLIVNGQQVSSIPNQMMGGGMGGGMMGGGRQGWRP